MRQFYDENSNEQQEIATFFNNYTQVAQTYFDYHGCLPENEDDADFKKPIKVTKLA